MVGGVKLDLRSIDISIDRQNFAVNSTTCREPFQFAGGIFGGGGDPEDPGAWFESKQSSAYRATGWTLTSEGLCRQEACVPVPRGREADFIQGGAVDIAAFWRHAGHPVVRDDTGAAWVLGTGACERARALRSLEAPDFALPDLDGRTHALRDHRGSKVLLVTWASW